jgi:PRTRC genetic system protein C
MTETSSTIRLKVAALPREFYYNGTKIPDPNPNMSVEQVRDMLTPRFPELATAAIKGPEDMGTEQRITFVRAIGEKG